MLPSDARPCTSKQDFFFRRAITVAQNSPCVVHRHGVVIVKDDDIVSEGYNHKRWHLYHKSSVHAEVDALSKLKHNRKFMSQCDMYVVRIGVDSMGMPLKYSRPCPDCTKAILKSGIRRVYYSTSHQFEQTMQQHYTSSFTSSSSASSLSS